MPSSIEFTPGDLDLAARIILSENQQDPSPKEQAAIAAVMRNRVMNGGFGGTSLHDVLTARTAGGGFQFTPLSVKRGQPNSPYDISPNDPAYQSAYSIAQNAFKGLGKDPTGGAVNYYAPKTQAALGQSDPSFAKGRQGLQIGQHSFYGPQRSADEVDDPDAFLEQRIKGRQQQAAPPAPMQTSNADEVDDPDAFLEQRIAGKRQTASTADIGGQTDRVQQAFKAMETQPDMVSRMFPIKSLTDTEGMARRYGYYLATNPNTTIAATAAAPLAAGAGAYYGGAATLGALTRMAPSLILGEGIGRGFQDIPSLFRLIMGESQ